MVYSRLAIPGLWNRKIPQALSLGQDELINEVYYFVSDMDVPNANNLVGLTRGNCDADKLKGEECGERFFDDVVVVSIVTLAKAREFYKKDDLVRQLRLSMTNDELDLRVKNFLKEHNR